MLRETGEVLDVPSDVLGRAVVIVDDGEQAVEDRVVDLPDADVDAEEQVDEEEDEGVDFGLDERSYAAAVMGGGVRRGLGAGLLEYRLFN